MKLVSFVLPIFLALCFSPRVSLGESRWNSLSSQEQAELLRGRVLSSRSKFEEKNGSITIQTSHIGFVPGRNADAFGLLALFWDYENQPTYLTTLKSLEYLDGFASSNPVKRARAVPVFLGIPLQEQVLEYSLGESGEWPMYWTSWNLLSGDSSLAEMGIGRIEFEQTSHGVLVAYINSFMPRSQLATAVISAGLKSTFKQHLICFNSGAKPNSRQLEDARAALYGP